MVGDAAHRFPHTGGYGLNSGVQDAHNIAWKLDAILGGQATDHLLDTYEVERRPVIDLFARHSVANHFHLDAATKHFGVTNKMVQRATTAMSRAPLNLLPGLVAAPLAEQITRAGLARTRILGSTGRRAQRVHDLVAGNIPGQLPHFVSTGLEYGYRYAGPLIATEPGEREVATGADDVVEYRPNTKPGGRLPHTVIDTTDGPRSTLELVDTTPTALTVFTFDPSGWEHVLESGVGLLSPLTACVVDLGSATTPKTAIDLYEVGTLGAVLVRADGHIVWRTAVHAKAAAVDLLDAIRRCWLPYFSQNRASDQRTVVATVAPPKSSSR
ncbi:FAD binding domain-containing protein [Williamsia limnetica]|uniref:FAD binding domain-containing protein n=2 Tax=Williamsia limnetica TaxID=882452 RepID=A0A318RI20_WILLI|nr:FAD binding domain-containing protein [Williamsia limnetica]